MRTIAFPTADELADALGCTVAELRALSHADVGALGLYLCEQEEAEFFAAVDALPVVAHT